MEAQVEASWMPRTCTALHGPEGQWCESQHTLSPTLQEALSTQSRHWTDLASMRAVQRWHSGHLQGSAYTRFCEVESNLGGRMHHTLRCKLAAYLVHACMEIVSNVTKLEMHGAERRPGRLIHAQVCTVRRARWCGSQDPQSPQLG